MALRGAGCSGAAGGEPLQLRHDLEHLAGIFAGEGCHHWPILRAIGRRDDVALLLKPLDSAMNRGAADPEPARHLAFDDPCARGKTTVEDQLSQGVIRLHRAVGIRGR